MRQVIFVNRYFHPDHSATSQILSDLAFHLASKGRPVSVVTSRQTYDDPAARLPDREMIAGVNIHRVWTSRWGRTTLPGRMADYASFYATAMLRVARIARSGDVVVSKTDPPLISVPVAWVAKLRRAALVNWLQDLYPEVATALGVRMPPGVAGMAKKLRDRSLQVAAVNVAIGTQMASRVAAIARRVPVATIPNWADDRMIAPVSPTNNSLRRAWGLTGKFVVGYSGNLGRAHEIDTILRAAKVMLADDDTSFLFIGGGHLRKELDRRVAAEGLTNVVTRPYQEQEALSESLSAADVHWVSLMPFLDGLIVPSKIYGIAAAGRPVVVVSSTSGELARLVTEQEIGLAVDVGDAEGLVSILERLRDDTALRSRLGSRASTLAAQSLSKAAALQRWEAALDDVPTNNR